MRRSGETIRSGKQSNAIKKKGQSMIAKDSDGGNVDCQIRIEACVSVSVRTHIVRVSCVSYHEALPHQLRVVGTG